MEPVGSCWSCGYCVPKKHSSLNCDKQKAGHQLGATRAKLWEEASHITGGNLNDGANQKRVIQISTY
eukprot:10089978-Ditylum_brightwellii.AAC.1